MPLTAGAKLSTLTQQDILQLQQILAQAGYDPGPMDGVLGPRTTAAYKRFLTNNAGGGLLSVQAQLVNDLIARLGGGEAVENPDLWGGIVVGNDFPQPAPAAPAAPPAAPAPAPIQPAAAGAQGAVPPGTEFVPVSDGTAEEYVRKNLPHLAYLLDTNPEVRDVLLRAQAAKWTAGELQAELSKTWWWKLTSDTTRVWDSRMELDNATAMRQWDERTVEVLNLGQQLGVPIDNEGAKWVAGRVLREGWSDSQLKRFLGQLVRNNQAALPGTISENSAKFKGVARKYLMSMSDQDALEYATRVAEGSISEDAVTTMMRQQSKGRFHWLSEQIDAGLTPEDLFRGSRETVARQLEIDPDQIDLNNPKWAKLADPIVENGQTRSMNYGEAMNWARQQAEWRYTKIANDEANGLALSLAKQMGALG